MTQIKYKAKQLLPEQIFTHNIFCSLKSRFSGKLWIMKSVSQSIFEKTPSEKNNKQLLQSKLDNV